MRVVICRSNPVDPDPRVEKQAAALSAAGHRVTVIAWDRTGSLPEKEQGEGYTLHRLPITADYARGMGNLWALLRWQLGLARWLIRQRRAYEVIHACDFDTVLPALMCKALFHKWVVYDIFDFYAHHLRATPEWVKGIIRWLDLRAIGLADGVILVDDCRREQIAGAEPRELAIIYNTPRDVYQELEIAEFREEGLRLVYVGLLQVERGLLELVEVLGRHPGWHLDLAGFGGDEKQILKAARKLDNIQWHGRIPYQQTLELTARCDVSIATYDPGISNHRFASPNKIFEAMMLGRPLIVARRTNMDRIVEEAKCGLVVEYGDEDDLERALEKLENERSLRKRLGANAREAYENQYSWIKMEHRLLDLYENLL